MSRAEYLEWLAFDALEPIGFKRDDWLAAHIARAAVLPHMRDGLKGDDFVPFPESRFAPAIEDDDDEGGTLDDWLGAAERAGLKVVKAGST